MPTYRPDFSEYVAHFTKSSEPFVTEEIDGEAAAAIRGSAYDHLVCILQSGKIFATPMP